MQGKVEVKSGVMLDREKLNKYLLTIVATDQGLVQRSDTAQVEVTVQDANDNSPVFQFNTYTASVREDSMSALPVGTVSATDIDIGINKAVSQKQRLENCYAQSDQTLWEKTFL